MVPLENQGIRVRSMAVKRKNKAVKKGIKSVPAELRKASRLHASQAKRVAKYLKSVKKNKK